MTSRIDALFAHPKLLCFGRYVMTAPQEARLIFGRNFPTLPNKAKDIQQVLEDKKKEILSKDKTAEVSYVGEGPAPNTWLIRYYLDDAAKQVKLESFSVYFVVDPHLFVYSRATGNGATSESINSDIVELQKNLRARTPDEIPPEPGICHEFGFVRRPRNDTRPSLAQAGLHIPSLPDVTFSVEVNDVAKVSGRGLLERIANQRKELGDQYPRLTTLREGKRTLHGWAGEESLVRRADGAHDFQWYFVGERGNIARPAYIDAHLFTKVAADRVGAADASSLNDQEAMALWERLLDGLKLRVAVPGANPEAVAIQ